MRDKATLAIRPVKGQQALKMLTVPVDGAHSLAVQNHLVSAVLVPGPADLVSAVQNPHAHVIVFSAFWEKMPDGQTRQSSSRPAVEIIFTPAPVEVRKTVGLFELLVGECQNTSHKVVVHEAMW